MIKRTFAVLSGVKVLDLSRIIVGPLASVQLADLGADVLKVEALDGDQTRKWGPPFLGPLSTYSIPVNRNKKSMSINLKEKEGQEIVHNLAKICGIALQNFIPGTAQKLNVGYSQLSKHNQKLVYCSISGYGHTGPQASEPAYDHVIQGCSGLMQITGERGGEPMKVGVAMSDVLGGLNSAIGILGGYINMLKTGKGCHVKTSLLESSIAALVNQASNNLNGGLQVARIGNRHPNIVPYGVFKCKDKFLVIGSASQSHFQALFRLVGLADKVDDPKFKTNEARIKNREECDQLLAQKLLQWESAEVLKQFHLHRIPGGPINTLTDVFNSQQVKALAMVRQDTLQSGQTVKLVRSPLTYNDPLMTAEPKRPPLAGEHTELVLREWLGKSSDQIKRLKQRRIVN